MNRLASSAAVISLLAGCPEAEPEPEPLTAEELLVELTEWGPHQVGYQVTELDYTGSAGDRTLRLAWWYPTAGDDGIETAYLGIFPAPDVLEGATPAPGAPWPVAVYSHGHQGYAEASGVTMAHLASHGWLVVAPDHTGNTTFDGSDRATEIYFQRPEDISAVLDHVTATPAGDPLAGAASPIVGLGHSFGGYTALALVGAAYDMATHTPACADGTGPSSFCSTMTPEWEALFEGGLRDPRITAAVLMAAGDFDLFGAGGVAQVSAPVLQLTGALDADNSNTDDGDPIWAALTGAGDVRADILTAGHLTFSDVSGTLESAPGLVDADEGWRIIEAYVTAWGRRSLGDDSAEGVLDGTIEVSADVVLSLGDSARR